MPNSSRNNILSISKFSRITFSISIFAKCQNINNRYFISIYRTGLLGSGDEGWNRGLALDHDAGEFSGAMELMVNVFFRPPLTLMVLTPPPLNVFSYTSSSTLYPCE